MRLTQAPNLRTEDFPSEQKWISRLFVQINPFIQALSQILNGNIDFLSNIKAVTRDYSVSSVQPFTFVWPFSDVEPADLRITKANKGTSETPTILIPSWSFDQTTRVISVPSVVEISTSGVSAPSGSYQFKVRATV